MRILNSINIKLNLPLLIGMCTLFFSCGEDIGDTTQILGTNSLYATIERNIDGNTRTIVDSQDGWSVVSFSNDDMVGLYAKTGNLDGDGSFINAPMMYSRSVNSTFQFDNANLNMDRSKFQYNTTMFYFPYSYGMETEGMVLRDKDTGRCLDVLMMGNLEERELTSKQQLSGTFNHLFSELILVRGEGFENAKNRKITVVMKEGFTRLRFIDNPSSSPAVSKMWKVPELYFDPSDGLSMEESRKWEAWPGQDFEPFVGSGKKEAYYVMLPNRYPYQVTGSNRYTVSRTAIDYIELEDNNGVKQQISSFTLNEGTKEMLNGWRYPMEIKMEGLVPTIHPFKILPWGEEQDITEERTVGINDPFEFIDWLKAYNQYVVNPSASIETELLEFGDKHENETTKEVTWHFYILKDLDFNIEGLPETNLQILKLTDILDGMGNHLENLNLSDSFIEEISGRGCLTNIVIRGLTVNNSNKNQVSTGIGALTNILASNGSIINCEVDATLKANCSVGIMAGEVTGGTVKDCNFSGLLIGRRTAGNPYRYLIGLDPQEGVFSMENTNFSGIIFSNVN